jgi:hypothetical protein
MISFVSFLISSFLPFLLSTFIAFLLLIFLSLNSLQCPMLCNLVFSFHFSLSMEFMLFFHVCSVAFKKWIKIKILGKEDGRGMGEFGKWGGGGE